MNYQSDNLFVDVCCGICLLGVLPQINIKSSFFIFSGDNICCEQEYDKRKDVFLKVCEYYNIKEYSIIKYNHERFLSFITGFEGEEEGGQRCSLCFEYRFINLHRLIEDSFSFNIDNQYLFTTTLSVSKYKDYNMIKSSAENFIQKIKTKKENNSIDTKYDNLLKENKKIIIPNFNEQNFRNDELYKKGILLSKDLKLYRQRFCGCEFSKKQR